MEIPFTTDGIYFCPPQEKPQRIGELTIRASSPILGKKLHELAEMGKIIGALRDGKVNAKVFNGSFTLQEGDTLLILGDPTSLKEDLEKIARRHH